MDGAGDDTGSREHSDRGPGKPEARRGNRRGLVPFHRLTAHLTAARHHDRREHAGREEAYKNHCVHHRARSAVVRVSAAAADEKRKVALARRVDELRDTSVMDRAAFVHVVRELHAELASRPEDWENPVLDRFFEALAAWVEDSDAQLEQDIDWGPFADALRAARVYE